MEIDRMFLIPPWFGDNIKAMSRLRTGLVLMILLTGCSPQQFFYYPNRQLYANPDRAGIPYEIVYFQSGKKNRKLVGLYFPAVGASKGSVIHFHGNFGNVSNHFPLVLFLPRAGYDVLSFDYAGYGASEGKPSPANLLEDGQSAVRFMKERHKDSKAGIILFGQSLGGSTAIQVAAIEPDVRGVVAEAAFSGHRAMGRDVLKRSIWTWPLYPIMPLFLAGGYDAVRVVDKISPRPILFIHGSADQTVPLRMSQALYKEAKEPKELWIVPGANHLECRTKAGPTYENKITAFIDHALR